MGKPIDLTKARELYSELLLDATKASLKETKETLSSFKNAFEHIKINDRSSQQQIAVYEPLLANYACLVKSRLIEMEAIMCWAEELREKLILLNKQVTLEEIKEYEKWLKVHITLIKNEIKKIQKEKRNIEKCPPNNTNARSATYEKIIKYRNATLMDLRTLINLSRRSRGVAMPEINVFKSITKASSSAISENLERIHRLTLRIIDILIWIADKTDEIRRSNNKKYGFIRRLFRPGD